MELQPFDLVVFLGLFAMFILGFAQGIVRRLLGLAAMIFSLGVAAQIRAPLGSYLAGEWTNITPEYSYMVAFGAVFVAAAIALTIGLQLTYRPAPLLPKYPVLDEVLGGVIGLVEGVVILVAVLLILDPYFKGAAQPASGEFGPLRSLHDFIDDSLSASIARDNVIPAVLSVAGWLFPKDVVDSFASVVLARI